MKKIEFLLIGLVLFFALLNVKMNAQCYELVWSDEFNDKTLNMNNWNIEVNGNPNNNELEYYTARTENITAEDTVLTITARKESYLGKSYTSGRINNANKFSFLYGKIEASIKLPYGKGIWPAFWMLGNSIATVGWPNCGEMDIMEMVGGNGGNYRDNKMYSTMHWGPVSGGSHPSYGTNYTLSSGKFTDAYHLFSLEWSPSFIRTYCDNIKVFEMAISSSGGLSAFQAPFYIILNLAVGGDWPGSPDGTTVFPQTMKVDYVRVYQAKNVLKINGNSAVNPSDSALTYKLPLLNGWNYKWKLPVTAHAISPLDSNIVKLNWGCTDDTIKCIISGGVCAAETLSLPVKIKQPSITGPMFYTNNQTGLVFSFPPLHTTTYNWAVPADAVITSGQGTDSITVTWGSTKDSVKIDITNTCGISHYAKKMWPKGEYPYSDPNVRNPIPGTINATQYDYGGEGVAYHDADPQNQGPGIRKDEGVDTENGDNGGPNVGWISAGEWLRFSILVAVADTFTIACRTGSLTKGDITSLKFFLNGDDTARATLNVTGTGSWSDFHTQNVNIFLYPTDTILKVDMGNGGFNLGNLVFTVASNLGILSLTAANVKVYPVPFTNELNIDLPSAAKKIEIIDVSGRTIMTYNPKSMLNCQLNTAGIQKGIYIVKIVKADGIVLSQKIIK